MWLWYPLDDVVAGYCSRALCCAVLLGNYAICVVVPWFVLHI